MIVSESLKTLKEKRFKLEKDLEAIKLTLQELEGKREEHASTIKELQAQRKIHEKMVHKLTVEIHNASLREKELELLLAKLNDEIRSLKESLSFDGLNSCSLLPPNLRFPL